jgi:Ca-activated chloride channel family protein
MLRRLVVPGFAFLLLLAATEARAAGLLVPRDGSTPIAVRSHRVSAVLENGLAKTTLRQTFVNHHPRALEAIYVFPIPENASLVDVAMEVGGQRLEGLLVERKRARKIYDDIVRRKQDPALVEKIGRSTFRLSVFPVLPKKETVVELTWIERVPLSQGVFRYVYPLALTRGKATTEQDLTFALTLRSSVPIREVTSANTGMEIVRKGPGEFVTSMERVRVALNEDISVVAHVAVPKPTISVTTFRRAGEEAGWFLVLVTPPKAHESQLLPRDIVLVLDTSGSMRRGKLDQAKTAARHLLANLRPADRVNVIRFSSTIEPWEKDPQPATPANLKALGAFVDGFRAEGGTALGDALKAALDTPAAEGRVRTLVLLTDGRPTIGILEPEKIVAFARAGAEGGFRVFPFGVGRDLDSALLEGIARAGNGRA